MCKKSVREKAKEGPAYADMDKFVKIAAKKKIKERQAAKERVKRRAILKSALKRAKTKGGDKPVKNWMMNRLAQDSPQKTPAKDDGGLFAGLMNKRDLTESDVHQSPDSQGADGEVELPEYNGEDDFDILEDPVLQENPYILLGFGVTIYFKILTSLILAFFVFSLLAGVNMYLYSSYKNYDPDNKARFSLGNLGFSSTKCAQVSL